MITTTTSNRPWTPTHCSQTSPCSRYGYSEEHDGWTSPTPSCRDRDGTRPIIDDEEHGRPATVCLCLTADGYDALGDRLDRVGFPEEGTLLEEYNELAYDECKHRAAQIDGLVDDECLDYYQNGTWLEDIYPARSIYANGPPPGFTCVE